VTTIEQLRATLERALVVACVTNRTPPFRVPIAIDHDLFRWYATDDETEARSIIADAVAAADGVATALADHHAWQEIDRRKKRVA
jgi:hypothetical protein